MPCRLRARPGSGRGESRIRTEACPQGRDRAVTRGCGRGCRASARPLPGKSPTLVEAGYPRRAKRREGRRPPVDDPRPSVRCGGQVPHRHRGALHRERSHGSGAATRRGLSCARRHPMLSPAAVLPKRPGPIIHTRERYRGTTGAARERPLSDSSCRIGGDPRSRPTGPLSISASDRRKEERPSLTSEVSASFARLLARPTAARRAGSAQRKLPEGAVRLVAVLEVGV